MFLVKDEARVGMFYFEGVTGRRARDRRSFGRRFSGGGRAEHQSIGALVLLRVGSGRRAAGYAVTRTRVTAARVSLPAPSSQLPAGYKAAARTHHGLEARRRMDYPLCALQRE